jgi:outer membrane protein, multidrug efflux system
VANSTAQVEATISRIPAYESSVREGIYTLSVLIGQPPAALLQELSTVGPIPKPAATIPVGLPSDLLLRRPDIRRAEMDLHAATARVGASIAEQFPKISLTGGYGTQDTNTSDFANLATQYWTVGAGARLPLFEGGRIQSNIALQKAATDEALAAYRKQVLVALREVEVALVNFTQQQARRAALGRTVDANREAVELSTQLYAAGRTDFLNVLAAQRSLLDSMEALAASDRAVADQSIALYKALGGGWDETQPPEQKQAEADAGEPSSTPAG